MSMVVFSFLLGAAEKKTVENEHKVLQSRQVVSQYLTLAISLTQTLYLWPVWLSLLWPRT